MKPIPKLREPTDWADRIALYGPMAAGKTYCAEYLTRAYGYQPFSLAGELKQLVRNMYGQLPKDGIGRKIYQGIGAAFREYDPDCWTKILLEKISHFLDRWDYDESNARSRIVVDDVRYLNEAQLLSKAGFVIVKVNTPLDVRKARFAQLYPSVDFEEASSHASEQEFDLITPDFIVNSSTVDVTQKLDSIVKDSISWPV